MTFIAENVVPFTRLYISSGYHIKFLSYLFFSRQTEEQYIFIHDALLEAVTCGETEVSVRNLPMHIQQLSQMDVGTTVTGMELEFKVITLVNFGT